MPPKEELFKPFEHYLAVRRAKTSDHPILEWAQFGTGIFFRPKGTSPEIVWRHGRVFSHNPWTKKKGEVREDFARLLSYHYRRLEFYRVVSLCGVSSLPAGSWVFARIIAGKATLEIGVPRGLYGWTYWITAISWTGTGTEFLEASHQFFVERVTHVLKEKSDEWMNALKWGQVDEETRFWGHVHWKNGNREEWLALVRAAMQIALVKHRLAPMNWEFFVLTQPHYNFSLLRMNRRRNNPPYRYNYPEAVWVLMDCIEAYFQARIDHSGLKPHNQLPPIHTEMPTQHESINALDLWREFGRKSGQLSQVEACLQQLLT